MSQRSYSDAMVAGRAGMLADNGPKDVVSKINPAVAIKFGRAVCKGSADRDVKLPTTAAEAAACIGISLVNLSMECSASGDPQYPIGSDVSVLRKGRVWVVVTEAVVAGNDVFVRFGDGVADGDDDDKGGFSDTADGTAQVDTITPTAVDSKQYQVEVLADDGQAYVYDVQAAGSGSSATTITTQLKAAINADTSEHGVTASGSSTTILTGVVGRGFKTIVSDGLALVNTTPHGSAAAKLPGAKFVTSASEDGLAQVEINLPV